MPTALERIEQDHQLAQAQIKESTVVEKTCRITLSKDWPRPVPLKWCKGRGSATTVIMLAPGQTIQQPLDKSRSWLGPFDLFDEYKAELEAGNERVVSMLRDHIAIEAARYLKTYDYPRGTGRGYHPDMRETGPHRSPDITVVINGIEGEDSRPFRLYEEYGIGPWDPLQDQFIPQETEDQIRRRYEAQLDAEKDRVESMRRELAKLEGTVGVLMRDRKATVNA